MEETKPSTSTYTSVQCSQPCRQIKYSEILAATKIFNESLVIGFGGFGKVYKGDINNGSKLVVAAIKRLDSMSNQGETEFWAEVEMLSKLRHAYLVSLIGYCSYKKECILVYEYMPNGTLADHLHKLGTSLSWLQRLRICIGAGRGLDYLHTGTGIESGIIHHDVKSSNILLNERWVAKVSDFGLSKICPANQPSTYVNTLIRGTFGYLDPNYFATGKLTRKSDVYAFGVVLFEVLCRKRPLDPSFDCGLATWAQDCIKEGNLKHIIDYDIKSQISPKCLKEFVRIAQRCLDNHPKNRPTMGEVVVGLESIFTLQKKIDNSLQTEGKTLFGRMVDMFSFSSKSENSDIQISPENSDIQISHANSDIQISHENSDIQISPENSDIQISHANSDIQISHENADIQISPENSDTVISSGRSLDVSSNTKKDVQLPTLSYDTFSYVTIATATAWFSPNNLLGEGRFGKIYKGVLKEGQEITVKCLSNTSRQGMEEFDNEVFFLPSLRHRNIVTLIGSCIKGDKKFLVYEYMPNKSLDAFIFGDENERIFVDWSKRFNIIKGIAQGLLYLHHGSLISIIHRNLKASNILLDLNMNPKISDFGLARSHQSQANTVRVAGKYGFTPPQNAWHGKISTKSDVYSFGVLLLEIVSGKRNGGFRSHHYYELIRDVCRIYNKGSSDKFVDATLSESSHQPEVLRSIQVGLLCVQTNAEDRPDMKTVFEMLDDDGIFFKAIESVNKLNMKELESSGICLIEM